MFEIATKHPVERKKVKILLMTIKFKVKLIGNKWPQ